MIIMILLCKYSKNSQKKKILENDKSFLRSRKLIVSVQLKSNEKNIYVAAFQNDTNTIIQ